MDIDTGLCVAMNVQDEDESDHAALEVLLPMIACRFPIAEVHAHNGYGSEAAYALVENRYRAVPWIDFGDGEPEPPAGTARKRGWDRYVERDRILGRVKARVAVEGFFSVIKRNATKVLRSKHRLQAEAELLSIVIVANLRRSLMLYATRGFAIPYADERATKVIRGDGKGIRYGGGVGRVTGAQFRSLLESTRPRRGRASSRRPVEAVRAFHAAET